jgi:acrylyl-CoA reductase (NADPH)
MRPRADRELAWKRLEDDLDRGKHAGMTSEIGLGEVIDAARRIAEGRIRRRIAVKIG